MSWYIHHRGEHANRCFAEVFESPMTFVSPEHLAKYLGPFDTKELATKAAERRGLTLTSLQDLDKK